MNTCNDWASIVLYAGTFANILLAMASQFGSEHSPWKSETTQLRRETWLFCGISLLCLVFAVAFAIQ